MADGKVTIEIGAEEKGLQKALNESSKKLKSYAKQLDSLDTKYKTIQKSRENAFAKSSFATDLQESKKALATMRDEIQARKDRAKAMKEEYPNMAKLYEFSNKKGVNKGLITINAKKWDVPVKKLEEYKSLLAEINSLSKSAMPMIGDVKQKQEIYDAEKAKLAQPNAKQEEILAGKEVVQGKWDAEAEKYTEISAKLDEINTKLDAMPKSAGVASRAFSTLRKITLQSAKNVAKFTAKTTWSVLSGSVKGLIAPFQKLHKSVSKFGNRLKYAVMQGLLLRPLRSMLSKVTEGFVTALKQNEQFSASLANLKGTIYTGLAPAFNALVPIISNFINWIAKALTYLFTFINMLFKLGGASKKAGKALGSAVESADGGGSNSSNFASWDTIQQLGSSSGGGGGAGGSIDPTYEQDFDKAEEYLAKIHQEMLADNWYGVGMEISKGLNDILTTIDTWLVSTYIPKMHEIGEDMGNLFNGLFDGLDPSKLGKTVADTLNGVVELFATFFETADLSKMTEKLATNINSLFQNFNFERLASGISSFVSGIFNGIATFFQNIDTGLIYERLKAFVTNIDWGGIAKSIFSALGSALGATVSFIWTFISDIWGKIVGYFQGFIDGEDTGNLGGNIIKGIFDGILNAVKNIGKWIKDNIFQPFIDGFKNAFQIHSPSKVMEEQGGFIVEGLLNGIKALPEKVKAKFEEMKAKIKENMTNVKDWVTDKATSIKDTMSDRFSVMKNNVSTHFGNLKTNLSNAMADLNSGLSGKATDIKDKFVSAFTTLKTKVTDVFNGLKTAIKTPLNGIIGFINGLISGIVSGINNMIYALNRLHFSIPSWIPAIGGRSFGFSINSVSAPSIPYLAQGTVVNPSHEFLAMLGDNRQEQEIVSPLSTMKQALMEALNESGISGNKEVVLQLDGKTLARATVPYYNNYSRQLGISAIR